MIIVFEGADCLGKSTLAKRVSELLNVQIVKKDLGWMSKSDLTGERIEEHARAFANTLTQLKSSCEFIVDRMGLSSVVYSNVYDRNVDTSWVSELIEDPYVFFVVITSAPSRTHLWIDSIKSRGEDLIDHLSLPRINDGFIDIAEREAELIQLEAFNPIDEMAMKVIAAVSDARKRREDMIHERR